MPVRLKLNGENGTPLGETRLLRRAVERQNEILEKIYQSISTTKTTSTGIKENTKEE